MAARLHDELVDFERHITKLIEQQEPTINKIVEQVRKVVESISPGLEVDEAHR